MIATMRQEVFATSTKKEKLMAVQIAKDLQIPNADFTAF